jgi:hypothetical protein
MNRRAAEQAGAVLEAATCAKDWLIVAMPVLPAFAPFTAMLDDPIGECALKPDIVARFFRFDPFVPQNLFAFRLEFTIQRRLP